MAKRVFDCYGVMLLMLGEYTWCLHSRCCGYVEVALGWCIGYMKYLSCWSYELHDCCFSLKRERELRETWKMENEFTEGDERRTNTDALSIFMSKRNQIRRTAFGAVSLTKCVDATNITVVGKKHESKILRILKKSIVMNVSL